MLPFLVVFLALVIPGYLATLFLPRALGFFRRAALTVVFGTAQGVIAGYFLVLLNPSFISFFLPLIALLSAVLALIERKRLSVIVGEWRELLGRERFFAVFFFALAVAAGIFIFSPHRGYAWPIHADEWASVSAVQSVLAEHPLNTNPYTLIAQTDYKPGFTTLLGVLFRMTGADPVRAWPFFPALSLGLIALVGAFLVFARTGSFFSGMLVPPFLAAIHSNAYVLGWWFFVPSTLAFLFLVPLLLMADELFADARTFFLGLLPLAALGFVYAPFLALMLLPLLVAIFRKEKKHSVLFSVLLAGISLIGVGWMLSSSPYRALWPEGTLAPLTAFFVPVAATLSSIRNYTFFDVLPIVLIVTGVVGMWVLRRAAWAKTLLAAASLASIGVLVESAADISPLMFSQRLFLFCAVAMALAGAAAAGVLLARLKGGLVLRTFLAVLLAAAGFLGYAGAADAVPSYRLVTPQHQTALAWLAEENIPDGTYVLAPPIVGTIITPLTGLPAPMNLLTMQSLDVEQNPERYSFFGPHSCAEKESIAVTLGAGIVYAHEPIDCAFLERIYAKDQVFIYSVIYEDPL